MKIFKLREDKVDTLRTWSQRLNTDLRSEALDTLREEGCSHEIFQLAVIGGEHYLITHMEGENIQSSNQTREINIQHRNVLREVVAERIEVETLYDLRT